MKILLTALIAINAFGQTQVDLKSQTKNIDFSGAATVSPFPVGFNLPATCNTGNMYFKSNAPTGANLYGCVAANSWTLESGGGSGSGGGSSSGASIPLQVAYSSPTALTIGQACTSAAPCQVGIGATTYDFIAGATVTISAGSGQIFVYVDNNGVLTVGESSATTPTITCANCTVATSVTQFPPDSIPLGTWTSTTVVGNWDPTGTDARSILTAGRSFTAGPNVTIGQSGSNVTISASLTTISSGVQSTCSATTRGTLWYTPGTTGVKDNVQVCAKDATDAYAWRNLY